MVKTEKKKVVLEYRTPEVKEVDVHCATSILNNSIPPMEEVDDEFDS